MQNEKIAKILDQLKGKKAGVFCDDSNLYHSYSKYGWRVDLEKFRNFLSPLCDLQFINYYVAIPDRSDFVFSGTENFLKNIKAFVSIKNKTLKYTPTAGKFIKKGDMDVEIVLDVVRAIDNLDIAIILSGDSDFYALKNYVAQDKNKKIIFVGYEENMAWELRHCWHLYLNRIKNLIELK